MSRVYFVHDALGQRRFSESDLPLRIGGRDQAGIALPDVDSNALLAFIALSDGHAYIQPSSPDSELFHNDERLQDSAWLKSGDRVQIGDVLLTWRVEGDKVLIDVQRQADLHDPRPPQKPPPSGHGGPKNEMPVHAEEGDDGRHGRPWRKVVISLVSLLVILAGYLLASTPVVIEVEPRAASVQMKGFPPPLSLWQSRLVLPGSYRVTATHPGYAPLDEQVDIAMDGPVNLAYAMQELPGQLQINAEPQVKLEIMVDEQPAGLNPAGRLELTRGKHSLRVETQRYLAYELLVDVRGYGEVQQLDIKLAPAWAEISISSQPGDAQVSVDGSVVGRTPLAMQLIQGRREVELHKAGYKPATLGLDIVAGQDAEIEPVTLQPLDGRLVIDSKPAAASVSIDDVFHGVTPLTVSVAADVKHDLKISKAGYRTEERQVAVAPDDEQSLQVNLPAQYGTVFLSTRPAGTIVKIDGKQASSSSGRLRLPTRTHTLTVSKPGYATREVRVTPREGVSQNIDVQLSPAGQAPAVKKTTAIPPSTSTAAGSQLLLVTPAATMTMGASRREAGRRANESTRKILLKRPFYFAAREVSNGEFRRFRSGHDSGSLDNATLNGDAQPVVNVSWDDAARYCNWLSEQQDLPAAYAEVNGKMKAVVPMTTGYRLPTEAEWAWVARRLTWDREQKYPWQGKYPPASPSGNYADARIGDTLADVVPGYDDGYRGTAPPGSFPAWPKGIYDLGGNVSEWMHDIYATYPGEAQRTVTDPSGPQSGRHHVVRGASWRHGNITELRLSYRDYSSKPRYDLGFRVARYAK